MLRYILILSLASAVLGNHQTTPVNTCNSQGPLPINLHIEGCDQHPCGFPQLQDAVVSITFRSPMLIRDMRTRAVAYLGSAPLIYPLGDQANACRGLTNSRCPVLQGEVLQYTLRMHVELFMPVGTFVNIEFSLMNHDSSIFGTTIICVRVPIRVDPPINQLTQLMQEEDNTTL